MSPTIFRDGSFRCYFFSREEPRIHLDVQCPDGEAKFWLEPRIALAQNFGLTQQQHWTVHSLIQRHADEIRRAWSKHFEG